MNKTYSLTKKRGIYQVIIYFCGEDGKRKAKWISLGINEKERGAAKRAKEKFEAIKREYENIDSAEPVNTLFSAYLLEWISTREGKCAKTTTDEYKRMATQYIKPYFDSRGVTLAKLTAGDLEDYYDAQIMEGLSPNSVIKQHAIIRSTLKWAVKHKWVAFNAADMATRPQKSKPNNPKAYNVQEVGVLLKKIKGHTLYAPVFLGALFGLRRSEALGLRWSCVDFDAGTIRIENTVVREHDGDKVITAVREGVTKTATSVRTLPLCDYTMAEFKRLRAEQERNRKRCGDCYNTEYLDFVCVNAMGDIIKPDYVSQTFAKLLKKYGLRHIRYHDLRHSCASILNALNYSMKDIQTWLGHSDYRFTANTYVETEEDNHIAMAEGYSAKLADVLAG